MQHTLRALLFVGISTTVLSASAQTISEATSIPAVGTTETRSYYNYGNPSGLATTGAGNIWDATLVTAFGVVLNTVYRAPGDSPYAASYPTTTICVENNDGAVDEEWQHFHVSATIAELLGVNLEEFAGGRTTCTYPFNLGDNFIDTYTVTGGIENTDLVEYVASGEITAPWGTIPNVVMFQVNEGPYTFYTTDNLLVPIGSYMPSFGLDLWKVDVTTGINEHTAASIGIWPVPATDMARVNLPFPGSNTMVLRDAAGRAVKTFTSAATMMEIDLQDFAAGVYTATAFDARGRRAVGRLVVQ